jgi:spectinomycin phosphotransferase
MLERPPISDERITIAMEAIYRENVTRVSFMPLGYDMHTALLRVEERDGTAFFLKLRKEGFNPIAVRLPQYLHRIGIKGIIPVIDTQEGKAWGQLDGYTTTLYPFIAGVDGYHTKLTDQQWTELGQMFKRIHAASIPDGLTRQISSEKYDPQWREVVRQLIEMVKLTDFQDPVAHKLSVFMKMKGDDILRILERADELAEILQQRSIDFVLCHADAHPGNYHITAEGEVYLVDWDNPTLAPKEHDLMCIGAGMSGAKPGGPEEKLFYQGYGNIEIDWQALTYYRYERIIQDIAEFGKQLLLTIEGEKDREQAYQYFVGSFSPGEVVKVAFQTDRDHITRQVDKG